MKKEYPSNAVVYLGEHSREESFKLAEELGLEIPHFDTVVNIMWIYEVKKIIEEDFYARFTQNKYVPTKKNLDIKEKHKVIAVGSNVSMLKPYECVFFDYTKTK